MGEAHFHVNGHPEYTLPNILNISFPEVSTETMLMNLDMEGIAVASGSACTSGSLEVSHVLKAMMLPEAFLHSAIRFSWGLGNTTEEIMKTAEKLEPFLNDCVIDPKGLFCTWNKRREEVPFHRLDRSGFDDRRLIATHQLWAYLAIAPRLFNDKKMRRTLR